MFKKNLICQQVISCLRTITVFYKGLIFEAEQLSVVLFLQAAFLSSLQQKKKKKSHPKQSTLQNVKTCIKPKQLTNLFYFIIFHIFNNLAFSPALQTVSGHWKPLVRFYQRVNSKEVGQIDKHILRKEPEQRVRGAEERGARGREQSESYGCVCLQEWIDALTGALLCSLSVLRC